MQNDDQRRFADWTKRVASVSKLEVITQKLEL